MIGSTLEPLAKALHVDPKALTEQFMQRRHTAAMIHKSKIVPEGSEWQETCRQYHQRRFQNQAKELETVVHFINVCFESSSELEQHFQFLQAITSGRKASVNPEQARARFKVKVDGPPLEEFVVKT